MVSKSSQDNSIISINDLLDRYYRNESLVREEILALINYEKFQLRTLIDKVEEQEFHRRFTQLQVMANITPYQEFLKEEYSALQ